MKKFLSLVLALVMTMSLVTISAGAKDFTDADEVNYDEAIAVLSAVKVIDGYPDGSFKPQTQLNRGQAAKIICNLVLGPTTASALKADAAPFKDVPADSTFAGYIAFCAKEGILSGYGDGTFKPGATLTGYAFMKMLLGALGYDAEIEGYNVPTWSISVAKQAIANGLDKGLKEEFDGRKPVTREMACQFALNTLKATMVDYDTKTTVNVGDATVTIAGSTAKPVSYLNNNSQTGINNDGHIGGKADGFVQFAEQYFPKLIQKDAIDAFGRPAWTWVYDKKEIDTFVDYTTLVGEFTEKVKGKDLYELITKSVLDDCNVYVYIDGEADKDDLGAAYFTKNQIFKSNDDGVGATGNGVLTQVFVDTDADEITIAIINTYLAKAAEDYDEKNEEVDLTVYKVDNKRAASQTPVFVKTKDQKETITVDNDKINVEDVEKDDLYLVQIADGEIQAMEPAEVLAEQTISNFKLGKYVTADGEKRDYADTVMYDEEVLDAYDDKNLKDLTYNVILDQYGYLIGLERNTDPDVYLFMTGIDNNFSNLSKKNADANVIFLDGTMKTVTVNVKDSNLGTIGVASQVNKWYTYTVDKNGVYTVEVVAPATNKNSTPKIKVAQAAMDANGGTIYIDKKHVSLAGAGTDGFTRVYGNDDTVYLNVELEAVSTLAGDKLIVDDVESVNTGVKNVKLTVKNVADKVVGTVPDQVTYNAPANEVYTLYKDNGYVIAAVVIAENDGISSNYAYITSATGTKGVNKEAYDATTDEWTWTREAIVNGKKVELTEVGDHLNVLDEMVQGEWYEVKYDADGNVRSTKNSHVDRVTRETISDPIDFTDANPDGLKFIDTVLEVETAVNAKDTVLLFDETTVEKLTYKNGTLYTDANATKGFSVSPDVKVVLCLADKAGKEFDKVDDTFAGYEGLEKAIRNLNGNFAGDVSALLEGGVATTIVLNNTTPARSGVNDAATPTVTIADVTVTLGDDVSLTPVVTQADGRTFGTLTYQWSMKQADGSWRVMAGETNKTLTLNADLLGTFSFKCEVTNTDTSSKITGATTATASGTADVEVVRVVALNPLLSAEIVGTNIYTNYGEVYAADDATIIDYANLVKAELEDAGYTDVTVTVDTANNRLTGVTGKKNGITIPFDVDPTGDNSVAVVSSPDALAQAISVGAETVYLTETDTEYTLPAITSNLTIIGNGNVTIEATDNDDEGDVERGLFVTNGNLVVRGVTFEGGLNGIVYTGDGSITIEDCTFKDITGAAIYLGEAAGIAGGTITNCTFTNCTANIAVTAGSLNLKLTITGCDFGATGKVDVVESMKNKVEGDAHLHAHLNVIAGA